MNCLYSLDFISGGPKLKINGSSHLNSVFGSVGSCIIFCSLVFCTLYLGYDIMAKENPTLIIKEEFLTESVKHKINNENGFIGINIEGEDGNGLPDFSKYIVIEATHYNYIAALNNSWNINATTKVLKPCSSIDVISTTLSMSMLDNMLCMEDFDFLLGGQWTESSLDIIIYEVKLNNQNGNSFELDKIKEYVKGKYLSIYFLQNVIDPKSYKVPTKNHLENKYIGLDSGVYKELELFFKTSQVVTDSGFFLDDTSVKLDYLFDYFTLDVTAIEEAEANDASSNHLIASIWIYSNSKLLTVQRSYIKVQMIAANLGGILKFLQFLFKVIFTKLEKKHINIHMLNQIFEVNEERLKNDLKQLSTINIKTIGEPDISSKANPLFEKTDLAKYGEEPNITSSKPVMLNNYSSPINLIKNPKKGGIKALEKQISEYDNKNQLQYTNTQLIKSILLSCFISKTSEIWIKDKIYNSAEKDISKYYNFETILSKLRELDVLKYILFSHNDALSLEFLARQKVEFMKKGNIYFSNCHYINKQSNATKLQSIINYFSSSETSIYKQNIFRMLNTQIQEYVINKI